MDLNFKIVLRSCLVMSSSRGKTKIQKEILDQVLNLFEKRRQDPARDEQLSDAARKRSYARETQQKSGGKYEPSTNFYKVFSTLVGEQTHAQKIVPQSKEDKAENVTRGLKKKPDVSQELKKTKKEEEKLEKTNRPVQLSFFERLSPRTKDEDETEHVLREFDKKPDLSREKQKTEKQEEKPEKANRSTQPSVFEMMSRRRKEGDETEHVTQDLNKKPDFSQEQKKTERQGEKIAETDRSAQLSVFERLSRKRKEEKHS